MRSKEITENGQKFLIVEVPKNMSEAFISKSGKSLVYRVRGTYLKSNGEICGKEDKLSGYLHSRFDSEVKVDGDKFVFIFPNFINYDFGDGIKRSVIRILIKD